MSSDQPIRKRVKPAHPGARIPDPAHPGLDLAQDGTEVTWDHHWIARERRGEVIVDEVRPEPEGSMPADRPDDPVSTASVPFMITKAQRQLLRQRGFSDDQVANMTPAAALAELEKPLADQAG